MDFKATGCLERNYKWLATVVVVAMSGSLVLYYFCLEDKSDTFIAASLYALLLFAAGVAVSFMNNEIDDRLQDRIEIYLNLRQVCGLLQATIEEALDCEAIRSSIIRFQVFTCRAEGMKERQIEPLIKQRGIKFNAKELEVENIFLNQYSKLSTEITSIVDDYIREYDISVSCHAVVIHSISNFEPYLWCQDNLSDYENDGPRMVSHIYDKLKDLNDEYSTLEILATKVSTLYSSYYTRAKLNVQQIEKMYGRKLQYLIAQQREIQGNFDYLFKLLKDIEDRIVLQIEEHDAKIETYVTCLERISVLIHGLCVDVDEIKDIVSSLDI